MAQPSLWDQGLWDEARWSYVTVDGTITEGPDVALGGIAIVDPIGGLIAEGPDEVVGAISTINPIVGNVFNSPDITESLIDILNGVGGDIIESPDTVDGAIRVTQGHVVRIYGDVLEPMDKARGNILNPKLPPRRGGGWAPQFHYKREWEIEAEIIIEPELEPVLDLEPDPYFIPQALPMDPAVARILQTIMQGPQVIDTDEEDLEAILMNL